LAGGGLLREVVIPGPAAHGVALQRLAPWPTAAPLVALAITVTFAGEICRRVRIAVTGTTGAPTRAFDAEGCLEGTPGNPDAIARAALALGAQVPFRDDAQASASYRREVAAVLLRRGLRQALARGRVQAPTACLPAAGASTGAAPTPMPYFTSGRIEVTLDGQTRTCQVEAGTSLLAALRALDWGHTRRGCDGGECGACVVRLDGRPVLACLTLAVRAHGRSVQGFHATPARSASAEVCGLCCPAPHPAQVDGAAWNALPCRCGPAALGLDSTPGEPFSW
jgi:xanthine dehydrogenase iron-sulfur cluster and FAD-binding subunit A